MTTLPDLLFVALFAIVAPVLDYALFWPAHQRLSARDPARARWRLWGWTIVSLWALVALGAVLWQAHERSWATLGLTAPQGWRLWGALGLCLALAAYQVLAVLTVARSAEHRATLRQQFGPLAAVLPQTRAELNGFAAVSLTAGFCEEFLYRGVFIWVVAPWLGWWGAAALSVPFFAVAHLYQGWQGVLRTGAVGLFLTLVVAVFESLWPAIVVHALIDLGAGAMAWLVLRDTPAERG